MGHGWRINDGIAVVLLAIVAIAPMPLASNRPMFWMMSATLVFMAAGVFMASVARQNRALPVAMNRLWVPCLLVIAYLVFMAFQVFGGLYSATPNAGILAMLRTLSYATFFFLVLQVAAKPKRASWMLKTLFYVVVFYAFIGFLSRFGVVKFPEILMPSPSQFNATATFVNRNSYATFLGFGLLTGVALAACQIQSMRSQYRLQRAALIIFDPGLMLYIAATLVISVTLFATNSRMGGAAVMLALAVFLLIIALKRSHFRALAVLLAVVALMAAVYPYGPNLLDRLGSIEQDVDVRFALYQQVWEMIMARPWAGSGADSFEIAFQRVHRLPVSADLVWDKAHNSYLTNWAETGLVFGSIPIILLSIAFAIFVKAVFKKQQSYMLPLLGLSVILQGAIHSLADFSLEIQANAYLFLAIVAIALADTLRASRGHK
ncbi:MAG: O-antigen ligase family protein [Rhodobacteraceae bacterium]|nr:O-antigen ligase family protein [Paracoccaceae bacterium]